MAKDERNVAIFEAYDDEWQSDPALPERNLMRAILLSAMSDLRKTGDLGRKAREFFLGGDESYLYSFQSICNHLEVDPRSILIVTGLRVRSTGASVCPPHEPSSSESSENDDEGSRDT